MTRGRSERLVVTRVRLPNDEGNTAAARPEAARVPDTLAVEEPLTIRLDHTTVTTTMRTPGHDFELAVGFCFTEGLLATAPVRTVRYCATGSAADTGFNTVSVDTGGAAPVPTPRLGATTSSCGWCGNEMIEHMCSRLEPLAAPPMIDARLLHAVPDAVRARQELFERTGSVHAAATFDAEGRVGIIREDVGRHNAVDKVIGALVLSSEVPATGWGLFVSGRASVEMVQKAWAAGFSTLLSVSAPTALAVQVARRANLVLAGFVRHDALNVYAPERLPPP